MEIVIRPMTEADLSDCAAVEATALDAWNEAQLAEELESQRSGGAARLFTAEADGKARGIAVFQLAADEASLYAITVDPALRRQGVGRKLLSQSLAALKEEGAESCYLEVRAQNPAARQLYEALGFETAGMRRNFYKNPADDAVIMRFEF